MYTYKYIILYVCKSCSMLISVLANTLLCLNLTRLIIKRKLDLEINSFTK